MVHYHGTNQPNSERYADMDVIGRAQEPSRFASPKLITQRRTTADQATHDLLRRTYYCTLATSVENEQLGRLWRPWLPLLLAWARKHLPTLRHAD